MEIDTTIGTLQPENIERINFQISSVERDVFFDVKRACDIFKGMVDSKHSTKLSRAEIDQLPEGVWFIPTFAIFILNFKSKF